MDYNLLQAVQSCHDYIQSEKDSGLVNLIYYSHIPTALASLALGLFVIIKDKASLISKIIFSIAVAFSLWNSFDLMVWTSYSSLSIMSAWSLLGFFNVLISLLCLYLVLVFPNNIDVSNLGKMLLLLPVIVMGALTPTSFNLTQFNAVDCEALENSFFVNGYYFFSLIVFIIIFVTAIYRIRKARNTIEKKKIFYLFAGVSFFLVAFFISGFLASYLDNYTFEFYGLFGMILFLILLGYLAVQFQAFEFKMIGAQALVFSLVVLIGAQFAYTQSWINITLNALAFALTLVAGFFLVRSVKKEVQRKEELQKLSDTLAKANDRLEELDKQKSEFISIASHQLRTPLTAIRGYISLALEGAYGKVKGTPIEDIMNKMYTIDLRLSQLVEDLLNVSKIEAGKVQYKWESVTLDPIVSELYDMFAVLAEKKGLKLHMIKPKTQLPVMKLDINKIKEILSNLIDNAIKYTEKGSVTIRVEQDATVARVVIEDTGIGISKEDALRLFGKFIRTETTQKMDAGGSGLGLFVGKTFVEGHGGRVYATSEGVGKGSSFIVELPLINPNAS